MVDSYKRYQIISVSYVKTIGTYSNARSTSLGRYSSVDHSVLILFVVARFIKSEIALDFGIVTK